MVKCIKNIVSTNALMKHKVHVHALCVCAGSTYKELMDYLGRDKQMSQMQLQLLNEDRSKLKQERDAAHKLVRACVCMVYVCACNNNLGIRLCHVLLLDKLGLN